MKEYHFGAILQSRELNLVLRKTGMIVRQVQFARFFRESTVRISKFLLDRNHEGNMKYYFTSNVLDGWTFQ